MTRDRPYATTPAEHLPSWVCPTCRIEMPVDKMPHRGCNGWDDPPTDGQ